MFACDFLMWCSHVMYDYLTCDVDLFTCDVHMWFTRMWCSHVIIFVNHMWCLKKNITCDVPPKSHVVFPWDGFKKCKTNKHGKQLIIFCKDKQLLGRSMQNSHTTPWFSALYSSTCNYYGHLSKFTPNRTKQDLKNAKQANIASN